MLKINFLGDSITEGALASDTSKTFVCLVGEFLKCEVRNYGISGTRIARQQKPSAVPQYDEYFASRVSNMKHDADFVFVFGGTNDFGHGDAPMGKKGDNTPDTFYGAMYDLISELLKFYKKEQIVFIPPLYRVDESNPYGDGEQTLIREPLPNYRKVMAEVLKERNITMFDIKDEIGKAENNPLIEDGLHPNDLGHNKIANLISNYIKDTLLKKEKEYGKK